jgi:hypothetical protein
MAKKKPTLKLGIDPDQNVDDLDANTLLERVEGMARRWQNERAAQFARNERWYHGDQWSDREYPDSPQFREWDRTLPKIDDNLLPNAVETLLARVLEMNPVAYLFAGRAAGASPIVARVGNRVFEHYATKLKWHLKLHDTCRHSVCGGSAGAKCYWNYNKAEDPETGEKLGDICLDPLTILDYATDGEADLEDSEIFYHTKMISRHRAFRLLKKAGYSTVEAKRVAYGGESDTQNADDAELEGLLGISTFGKVEKIRATEIWVKPGDFIEKGRFVSYVGTTVVDNRDYTADHNELPLATIRWRPITGSAHGSTPMDSLVKLQRAHNEALSVRTHRIYEGRHTYIWGNPRAMRQMRAGGSAFIDRLQGDDRPPEVITHEPKIDGLNLLIEDSERAIDKASGTPSFLNHGGDYNQRAIGKSMAYMNFATGMKNIRVIREVWAFTERLFMQILQLVQQHYTFERLVDLLGPGSELDAEVFLKANLAHGYVVKPAVGHGDLLSRMARATEAQAAVVEGTMDPERGAELGQTGLDHTQEEAWTVQMVHRAAKVILEGGEAEAPERINPMIAVRELERLIPIYREAQGVDGLEDMLEYYQAEMMQQGPPAGAPMQPGLPAPEQQMLPPQEMVQ